MTHNVLNTLQNALASNQLRPESVDYPALRLVAQRLAIRPWLTSRYLLDGGLDPLATADHHQDVMRVMAMMTDLRFIADVAARMSARVLIIKGAALIASDPSAAPWRHTEDIDVVAPPGVADALHRALLGAGAQFADLGESLAVDGTDYHAQVTDDHHALFPLVAPMGTMIDVHRTLPSRVRSWARIARRSRPLSATFPALAVPSPSDHLTILADHALLKHRAHPAALTRHMVDTRFLLREGATLDSSTARASAVLLDALAESSPFGAAVRRALVPDDHQYRLRERVDGSIEQVVRIRRDVRWRPRTLWYKLLPHAAYMDEHFGAAHNSTERVAQHLTRWRWLLRAGAA